MNILIRKAVIFEPGSSLNGKSKDILIVNGSVARIADHIDELTDQVIEQPGLCASPGWVDVFGGNIGRGTPLGDGALSTSCG